MVTTNEHINDVRRKLNEIINNEENRIVVGWRPTDVDRKEGDVWEEGGRKWTVKNGIKQNVTKLDTAKTPWWCPNCKRPLNHRIDVKFWGIRGKCMECVTAEETELKRLGKYKEYEQEKVKANYIATIKDKIQELEHIRDTLSAPEIVHADEEKILMIEKWNVDLNKLRVDIQEDIDKLYTALAEAESLE
jgi:hypothetical protein